MKTLTLALGAAVALAASGAAMAQSQTLTVDGTIPSVCTLVVDQGPAIALENNNWQHVADVTGECNSGSNFVEVQYTHDFYDNGSGFASFRHNTDTSELITFEARVTPPGGTSPFLIPVGMTFPISQGNGVLHELEFSPHGSTSNLAGGYNTIMTINVVP